MPIPSDNLPPRTQAPDTTVVEDFLAHFAMLAAVPRPSGHEQAVSDRLKAWGGKLGFNVRQNAVWDLVIDVPPTPGLENSPVVGLQAHLDMVCVGRDGRDYDALRDPVVLLVDRAAGTLKADGTSLGADDGAGVALAMSIAEGRMPHGPLRLIFTADEEVGMTGARALTPEDLRGVKYLVNIDSEASDAMTVSSAADCELLATASLQPAAPTMDAALEISIVGLSGGHSGMEIASGRCNAIVALADTLARIGDSLPFELASFSGGTAKNAIPAKARATIVVETSDRAKVEAIVSDRAAELESAHARTDPGLCLQTAHAPLPETVMPAEATARLLRYLAATPNGVLAMSQAIEGLVETSSNLGRLEAAPDRIWCLQMPRSSDPVKLREIEARQTVLARECDLAMEIRPGSRAWPVNPASTLVPHFAEIYRTLTGRPMRVVALHAGLECGILSELAPGLDIVSIGPDIDAVHSPNETLRLSSIPLIWHLLEHLLANPA